MIRKDFFEKQLEQLGLVIAKLTGDFLDLKNNTSFSLATEKVNEVLKSEFNSDLNELNAIEKEQLIEHLTKNKNLKTQQLDLLADLLFATAQFYENSGERDSAKDLYTKTLAVYEYVNEKEKTFSAERQQKITTIKTKTYEPE